MTVVRPRTIRLADPPPEVTDQAQGIPVWGSQIVASAADLYEADVPDPSAVDRPRHLGRIRHPRGGQPG